MPVTHPILTTSPLVQTMFPLTTSQGGTESSANYSKLLGGAYQPVRYYINNNNVEHTSISSSCLVQENIIIIFFPSGLKFFSLL